MNWPRNNCEANIKSVPQKINYYNHIQSLAIMCFSMHSLSLVLSNIR